MSISSANGAPTASVVIPTRDRPQLLRTAVEAVIADAERSRVNVEVIVVDASADGSAAWVKDDFGTVSYLRAPAVGAGGNRPQAALAGAGIARADFICFLDDDASPRPGWLGAVISTFGDGVGGVGGRVAAGPSPVPLAAKVDREGRMAWSGFNSEETGVEVDFLPGGNMCFRREVIATIDPSAFAGYTGRNWRWETDLCVQVRRNGWRLIYTGDAIVDHSPPAPPRLNFPPERFGLARNEAIFALRLFPGSRTVLAHVFSEPARDLYLAVRTAAVALLAGFASVLGRWAGVVRFFRRS
jgi:GT2 family glycosyltransferase